MASPFSQTMESRRGDYYYVWIAVMTASVILALLWGNWFLTSPIIHYETSRKISITDQESLSTKFSENMTGTVRPRLFKKRRIIADFASESSGKIKPGQAAYVYVKDKAGKRTVKVPATVIEAGRDGRVILESEVLKNLSNPFENSLVEKIMIESGHLTPADMFFQSSGLGKDSPPVLLAPRNAGK